MAKYDYKTSYLPEEAEDIHKAIRSSIIDYMHHQLGWTIEECERRVSKELERRIPKDLFQKLETEYSWDIENQRLLDVGSGQGGSVHEALVRGADAYGVEPGHEFSSLSKRRLQKAGYDPSRISETSGESLPFPNDFFDYAISLQVLEHVAKPRLILEEIYRVLKPGGKCYIRCDNYLSFREQHYRVFWIPLLPKKIGSIYLKLIGRDPSFLNKYVFYTTYPEIWSLAKDIDFKNTTYRSFHDKLRNPQTSKSSIGKLIFVITSNLFNYPKSIDVINFLVHCMNFMRPGVRLHLIKPQNN